ncbi:MAG TPA: SIMPL domain-containing protein [Coprothermobacter proteolyticus]|nr:SIMPL domain-containing protein [Coprothermobacter proteolyticus]
MKKFYSSPLLALAVVAAVLLGAWLLPVGAASTDSQETPTISVNGIAKVEVVPDMAVVNFVVEATQQTASKAMAQVTKGTNAVVEAVKDIVKDEKNINTSNVSVYPWYDYTEKGTELLGYRAVVQISVKSSVEDLPSIIDEAFTAGATGMSGIAYEYSKTASVMDQLIKDAMADARHKAEVALSAEHATPGKLASVQVLDSSTPIWQSQGSLSKDVQAMAQDINIMPGVQEVSVSVSVSYVINQ